MSKYVISHRFFSNVNDLPDKDALLSKIEGKYRGVTYRELGDIVKSIALVLDSWGIKKGDRVSIISDNREEWVMSDLAIVSTGAVSVPIYPTLTTPQINQILKHARPRVIFVANEELLGKIENIQYKFEHIILFDAQSIEDNISLTAFDAVKKMGMAIDEESPKRFKEISDSVQPEDLACINYTSGTTGDPKGVMLTHKNFVGDVQNSITVIEIKSSDTFLSFLPLSHVLERMGGYYVPMILGATIGFAESIETVVANMAEVRPTIVISVPRLFEKIYSTVMSGVEQGSGLKRTIFYWALRAGKARMDSELTGTPLTRGQLRRIKWADKLVFSKLQTKTGGRLTRFVSGGAPLSKEIAEFLWSAGLKVYEGYGLTETSPVITVNGPGNAKLGSVGIAIPETQFKIDEDGEILVKGPQVMEGYYKNEVATKEVIDSDGYLHTGDIGYFDDDGFLFITDRKKNILVTAGGKNVAPQPIEESIKLSKYISYAVLIGDRKSFISALIVIDQESIKEWAKSQDVSVEPYDSFIKLPEVYRLIEDEIEQQTSHFSHFEKVKKFKIVPRDFTIEGNELTPSLKVRRKVVMEEYNDLIEEIYSD